MVCIGGVTWTGHVANPQGRTNTAQTNTVSISGPYGGSDIVVTVGEHVAGAVCNVTWNGIQFVNDNLNGRDWQSDCYYDQKGECDNPTESGASDDQMKMTSLSRLNYIITPASNQIQTGCNAAAFRWNGQTSAQGNCLGNGPSTITVQPTQTQINKVIVIGPPGLPANVLKWDVSYYVPGAHTSMVIELAAFHCTGVILTNFYSYNPTTTALTPLAVPVGGGLSNVAGPLILATPTGSGAVGIYRKNDAIASTYSTGNFTNAPRTDIDKTTKINIAFARGATPINTYDFTFYACIGTLANVESSLTTVFNTV